MIKGISILRPAGNAAAYERLSGFFRALGFAPGKGWQEEGSRGASFMAPLGNLEFVDGRFPSTADLLIEVTSLDSIHQVAEAWLRAHAVSDQSGDAPVSCLSPISKRTGNRASSMSSPNPASASASGRGPTRRKASPSRSKAISLPRE